ncbi:hypothetical protein IWW48_001071 [Coemansia sp. RSA 1200]|nr:hypothetical protein IWW48_001071 [Coemansia sp. RSA 1200]
MDKKSITSSWLRVCIDMVSKGYGATLEANQIKRPDTENKATAAVLVEDGKAVIKMGGNMPAIFIDGPYPAPTEHFFEYEVGILIAAGIGVTPAASVLRSVYFRWMHGRDKLLTHKVYLFWVYRDIGTLEWFKDILVAVEEQGLSSIVEVHTYYTGEVPQSAKLENAPSNDRYGSHTVSASAGMTSYVGRPNFDNIFEIVGDLHPGTKVGTFFCGPKPMARKVRRLTHRWDKRLNKAAKTRLEFHSEVFF